MGCRLKHCSRVLLSQDRNEIFFTIAEYTDEYVDYLHQRNNVAIDDDFYLSMCMFGPFLITNGDHMKKLAPLIKVVLTHAAKAVQESSSVDHDLAEILPKLHLEPSIKGKAKDEPQGEARGEKRALPRNRKPTPQASATGGSPLRGSSIPPSSTQGFVTSDR
jgi:hypothetical protein